LCCESHARSTGFGETLTGFDPGQKAGQAVLAGGPQNALAGPVRRSASGEATFRFVGGRPEQTCLSPPGEVTLPKDGIDDDSGNAG
jgi:hypothetical protein